MKDGDSQTPVPLTQNRHLNKFLRFQEILIHAPKSRNVAYFYSEQRVKSLRLMHEQDSHWHLAACLKLNPSLTSS